MGLKKDTPSMSFKVKEDNIGLLTVGSFQNSDFNRTYFDELYDEILKTDALIIDIRNNSSGNSSHADYLISHFIHLPIPQGTWSSPMYIAAHASWNYPRECICKLQTLFYLWMKKKFIRNQLYYW